VAEFESCLRYKPSATKQNNKNVQWRQAVERAPAQDASCDDSEMRFLDPGAFQGIVRNSEALAHIRKEPEDGI
jgi:hypothetical protein